MTNEPSLVTLDEQVADLLKNHLGGNAALGMQTYRIGVLLRDVALEETEPDTKAHCFHRMIRNEALVRLVLLVLATVVSQIRKPVGGAVHRLQGVK
jgi:hypothetical protein